MAGKLFFFFSSFFSCLFLYIRRIVKLKRPTKLRLVLCPDDASIIIEGII